MGDSVYELLVREHLSKQGSMPAHTLHILAVRLVRASAQAHAVEIIGPLLTEDEATILKRGRNANSTNVPKNSNPADYRLATGLEALFGYLYLKGDQQRINELFEIIWQSYCDENDPEKA